MVKPNGSRVRQPRPAPDVEASARERILDAAHQVFLRRGTAGARTQEIADEAGVNKALVHYYFGTKDALAEAVFQRAAGAFLPTIFGVLAAPDLALEARVAQIAERQVAFHRAHPYLAIYLLAEVHTAPERLEALVGRHGRPVLSALQAQLDAAAAAGTIRAIPVADFLVNLMSLLVFPVVARPMVRHVLGLGEAEYERLLAARAAEATRFFLDGLRP